MVEKGNAILDAIGTPDAQEDIAGGCGTIVPTRSRKYSSKETAQMTKHYLRTIDRGLLKSIHHNTRCWQNRW